jgi:TonB family protein
LLFEPATDNGEPVAFGHKVSISFSPSQFKSDVKKRGYSLAPSFESQGREEVYEQVEIQAQVGEHRYELAEFIKNNLKYPQEAFERNISGQVMVRLVVEKSGLPSNMKVIQSIGGGCDEEALRILSKLRWNPAKARGESVRSWIEIPIVFSF